jgi:thioredoxin 1
MAEGNGTNSRITAVTAADFEAEVKNHEGLVVVDFWADWCGPCKMLAPIMEELSCEMTDVKFCKVNVDEELSIAMNYKIASIPTLLFVKGGETVGKSVGYQPKEEVKERIEELK